MPTLVNVSWLPRGNPQWCVYFSKGDYGDVVIWLGRLWVSWFWPWTTRPWPEDIAALKARRAGE